MNECRHQEFDRHGRTISYSNCDNYDNAQLVCSLRSATPFTANMDKSSAFQLWLKEKGL